MKNILFVSPTSSLDNGAEIAIYHLMDLLVSRGHTVYNVTHTVKKEDMLKHQKNYQKIGVETFYLPSSKWWWPDAPGELRHKPELLSQGYRQNIRDIVDIIQENHIDVVVSNTVNVFQGAVAAKLTSIPHCWLIHEFPEQEFAYYLDKIDFIADYSDSVFSVAGNLQDTLQSLFGTTKVGSFIPYSTIQSNDLLEGDKKRIVSVGKVNQRKNQLELLQAYQELSKQGNDVELVFVGSWEDDYKKLCDQFIKKNHLKKVTFTGFLENPWSIVTDKDICVFPSSQETFGLVYIEAALRGIPVIMSDNLGHKTAYDLIKEGQMYQLGDISQLSTLISDMLEAPNDNTDMSRRALQNYTPQKCYQELVDYLEAPVVSKDSSTLPTIGFLVTDVIEPGFLGRQWQRVKRLLKAVLR